jgi:DNA-binding transcriptional ArsR family regulator
MSPRATTAKKQSKRRFEELNEFVDRGAREADLSLAAFATWACLYRHAREHRVSVPISALMANLNVSRPTVMRALAELKAKRMMKVVRKGGLGHGTSERVLSPRPRPASKSKGGEQP